MTNLTERLVTCPAIHCRLFINYDEFNKLDEFVYTDWWSDEGFNPADYVIHIELEDHQTLRFTVETQKILDEFMVELEKFLQGDDTDE